MVKKYYPYTKKHFEYEVKGILMRNKLGYLTEITEEYRAEGHTTWERIYALSTKNKAVRIIIFSSVDINTNQVREVGADAVKIVTEWTIKGEKYFSKVAHHYRIDTLFKNMEKTLVKMNNAVFSLNYKDFSKTP